MQVIIFSSPDRDQMLFDTIKQFEGYDIAIIGDSETFGKDNFWKRWEQARKLCLNSPHDNYLFLTDDGKDYDVPMIETYFNVHDTTQRFMCAVISDERESCYGSKRQESLDWGMYSYEVYHIDFNDCGGLTNRATLDCIEISEPKKIPGILSSGVGRMITEQLRAHNVPMYKTVPSLCHHGEHPSVMHPEERKRNPLVSHTKGSEVVIGIATMAGREKNLELTLQSLEGQADRVVIYNNALEQMPDLADNGKFYPLPRLNRPSYFLSCDDDIVYPPTYVEDMKEAIDKHGCIVTHHGRKLLKPDVSYYEDHTSYHCLHNNDIEAQIDVAGTGVTGFHTSYFHPKHLHSAKDLRMSDLVFSLEAAKQDKKIMVLPHKQGYLSMQYIPEEKTIFGMCKDNESRQIEVANQILKLNRHAN